MLELRSLFVSMSACSIALAAALWFGTRGHRRHGMEQFLAGFGIFAVGGFLLAFRGALPYALSTALANGMLLLAFAQLRAGLLRFAGRSQPPALTWGLPLAVTLVWFPLEPYFAVRLFLGNALGAALHAATLLVLRREQSAFSPAPRRVLRLGFGLLAAMSALRALGVLNPAVRSGNILTANAGTTATMLGYLTGVVLVCVGYLQLLRERTEAELGALNETLAARVATQVEQLNARAREVEKLNLELEHKVAERSHELEEALEGESEASAKAPGPGTVLGGRYELGPELGRGGMGVVYRARDKHAEGPVAVKLLRPASEGEVDSLYRFLREAQASARVAHPAVVYARDVDHERGWLYLTFELVEGASLDHVFRRHRRLDFGSAALLGARIAEVLAAAHRAGVVHRDLKPANVMLARQGPAVRLLDFGIARLRDATHAAGEQTRRGAILGTPAYMAPEQALDASSVGAPSDVYSLGVILFEALSGKLPFREKDLWSQMVARLTTDAPSLQTVAPQVPEALSALVDRCLHKEPSGRPTAEELLAALAPLASSLAASEERLRALAPEERPSLTPSLTPPAIPASALGEETLPRHRGG